MYGSCVWFEYMRSKYSKDVIEPYCMPVRDTVLTDALKVLASTMPLGV